MTPLTDLAPYLLPLSCAGLAAFFFLQLKRAQQESQARWNKRQQLLLAELGQLRGLVNQLRERLDEAERRSELSAGPVIPASGMNLNRRTHALRLFRRGERPEQIAATLGVPLGEVELLRKVQRITAIEKTPLQATTQTPGTEPIARGEGNGGLSGPARR
jgi:hypothetical protein